MAHYTKVNVGEKTRKFLESVGYTQVNCIAPTAQFNPGVGLMCKHGFLTHPPNLYFNPDELEHDIEDWADLLNLIYCLGYNQGARDKKNEIRNKLGNFAQSLIQ